MLSFHLLGLPDYEFNLRLHVVAVTPPQENTDITFDGYIEAERSHYQGTCF
jgi:hypothetical protein